MAAVYARKAGAAVAHIHVRNPETGKPSMAFELYEEVVQRIRDSGSDVLVNLTTGAGGRFIPGAANPAVGGPGKTLKRPEERSDPLERSEERRVGKECGRRVKQRGTPINLKK